MKKQLVFLILGLITGLGLWLISTKTILLHSLERDLVDGFFYLRELDPSDIALGTPNPFVADSVLLAAIDDQSLGTLGKWPWYRDVHARFLKSVEQFSPAAVYFDIAFVLPESIPESIKERFGDDARQLAELQDTFNSMDNSFARELQKHDNVYLDLFLVGDRRPDIPYLDRIKQTEEAMERYAKPADPDLPAFYHSLEPIVETFIIGAHPVTVNAWPDKDEVVRSYLLYHPYERTDGGRRNYFSAVLALLMRYYHIEEKEQVSISEQKVILHDARTPVLGTDRQPKIFRSEDFKILKEMISLPDKSGRYNDNLYNFLVNEYLFFNPAEESRVPLYPLHLLITGDNRYELLDGREVYDAAVTLGSDRVDVIYYKSADVSIELEKKFPGTPDSFPINYAGREENLYVDPYTGEEKTWHTVSTESYLRVIDTEDVPGLPLAGKGTELEVKSDPGRFFQWFIHHMGQKSDETLTACRNKYGNLEMENVIACITGDMPEDGRFVTYSMFIDDIYSMINSGDLPEPGTIGDVIVYYPEWLSMKGLNQDKQYWLTEESALGFLQDQYRILFDRYYNKYVFTGAYSAGMAYDIKVTPYGSMFGINVTINAFDTIITDNQLKRLPEQTNTLILIGFCLLFSLLYGTSHTRLNSYIFVLSFASTFLTGYLLFALQNIVMKTVPLVIANLYIFIAVTVIKVFTEEKDKKFLKKTFAQYVSPELIETMYESKTHPELGGSSNIITAYFTDIQSFSTFSEKLTAEQLVELLNEYLSEMTDILLAEQGTLDKYEGDAIIAFFGAPMRFEDHALRACRVAIRMQNTLLRLREKWSNDKSEQGNNTKIFSEAEWGPGDRWPRIVHNMRMRIGINTGEIVTGNIGSRTRMNYTMMGDSVNLAARLEAGAKQYGVFTMISEYTYRHEFHDDEGKTRKVADFVEARFIDNIAVVGKSEPVRVYELVAMKGDLAADEEKLFRLFGEAMELYLAMQWDEAADRFAEAMQYERYPDAKTNPSEVYSKRCLKFKEEPPVAAGETWDGVYRMTQK